MWARKQILDRTLVEHRDGPDILADLDSLTETEIEYDGKRFIVRSAPRPARQLGLACSRRRAAADRPRRNCLLTLAQSGNVVPSRRSGANCLCLSAI